MPAITSPQKITFAEMRDMGVRGVLVYRADYHCSHSLALNGDRLQPSGFLDSRASKRTRRRPLQPGGLEILSP
jgi:hypothetical protein